MCELLKELQEVSWLQLERKSSSDEAGVRGQGQLMPRLIGQ